MVEYDVWVLSEASGKWERYTAMPFYTLRKARAWIAAYIPDAVSDVRTRTT